MAPRRDVPANEGNDFFCGIYIFEDVFILIVVPMIARNRELVGLFQKGYCKLVRSAINQSTCVLVWV